mgnify:CR=1 FL=1
MIEKINFNGIPAVHFTAGGYEAVMVPSVGANVVKLKHTATGIEILRTPDAEEMENFKERPQIYGLPLLFPPNRIADGTYTFEGRKYQYPITIPHCRKERLCRDRSRLLQQSFQQCHLPRFPA